MAPIMETSLTIALLFTYRALSVTPPSGTLSTILPRATDTRFGNFISDTGAGGYVQKWNQSLFSISDGSKCYTTHTGYAAIDANNPSNLIVIGDYNDIGPNHLPNQPDFWHGDGGAGLIGWIPSADVECDNPTCFAPAPHVAPIPIPGNDTGLLNVWPVHPNEGAYTYNTMFEMNFPVNADYLNDVLKQQVPAVRTAPVLFNITKSQAGYGSAALTSGRGNEANTYFYLWEGDSTGWKLARAPWASRADKTTFDYWHGSAGWVRNAPLRYNNDAYGNLANVSRPGLGVWGQDIRWVDRFQTYVITFQGAPGYSQEVMYSTTGAITGPYSAPVTLFTPTLDSACSYGNNTKKYPFVDFIQMHWDYYEYGCCSVEVMVEMRISGGPLPRSASFAGVNRFGSRDENVDMRLTFHAATSRDLVACTSYLSSFITRMPKPPAFRWRLHQDVPEKHYGRKRCTGKHLEQLLHSSPVLRIAHDIIDAMRIPWWPSVFQPSKSAVSAECPRSSEAKPEAQSSPVISSLTRHSSLSFFLIINKPMSTPPTHVKFILAETHFYNPITPTSQLAQQDRVQTKKLQKKCRRPKGGAAASQSPPNENIVRHVLDASSPSSSTESLA
ncbi:hypothetical protein M409DRAFT_48487 [Zasmidium cellare ATCC 36951]|uniref:Glycoside hydrolase family 16 protein n=1 Tax=Zasmidium cellare ATCC 36951 TaxID=1080233 RepID=A0A6A6D280_ZASCE|nr:uncharacterized protein M409DRAFT_48487 [Zasmidium cellare ATCC 36951]KAF2173524.1 hypothetical protein M409DRAFT_48487 [Zasmidium cellare ATCC 36951]